MPLKNIEKIEEMIKERNSIKNNANRIENKIFKTESEYLELTQGFSLFKNLEFYIHAKPDKKKMKTEEEEDRVFSTNYPTQK